MADISPPTDTPLHTAACSGQIEEVRKLLKSKRFKVDTTNTNKHTPLHLACVNGHLDLVDVLVSEFNADIGALDKDNNTPLLLAAANEHVQIVFMIILMSMYGTKCSAIRVPISHNACAVETNNAKMLHALVLKYNNDSNAKSETSKLLLTKFGDVFDSSGDENFFPLFLAAYLGLTNTIAILIREFGVNPACKGFFQLTILFPACFRGHSELVDILVSEYHLDPLVKDKLGSSILHYAAMGGNEETIVQLITKYNLDLLSHNNFNVTPLCLASLYGHRDAVHFLIKDFGCNPHCRSSSGRTLLHNACEGGHTELVEELISEFNLDPTATDDDNNTPLHIAAGNGHIQTVRHLTTVHKIDINSHNKQNNTPLCLAALYGHSDTVQLLIKEFNCNPFYRGFNDQTILHNACEGGHIELVEELILEFILDPMAKDAYGKTPLHIAARNGHVHTVRYLITVHKVETDSHNENESTPLCLAALNGHINTVQLLIKEFNCNPFCKGYNGRTLLHNACQSGHTELADQLISEFQLHPMAKDISGNTPLHLAARHGHVETVKHLITIHKVETDSRNENRSTPLCLAALNGHTDAVRLLIKKFSCNQFCKGYSGRTLLHNACEGGHTELAYQLISEFLLDPMAKDDHGETPLHLAARHGHVETVKHLITVHKVETDSRNENRSTPLCLAALNGHIDAVRLLINEFSCNQFCKGFNGRTLLHNACEGGHRELVEELISEFLLDPMAKDDHGETPLHLAAMHGHGNENLVRLLINVYNVDTDAKANVGNSALHLATLHGKVDLVHTLINEFGYDPAMKGFAGQTILHKACSVGNLPLVVALLSDHKVSVFSTDDDGNTPLHISVSHGHVECVHLLFQYKAPLYARNKFGDTATDIATNSKASEIIQEIKKYKQEFGSEIQATYERIYRLAEKQFTGKKHLTRLFVIGHPEAGKSTLIKTLKKEGNLLLVRHFFTGTPNVTPHTAGIVPSVYDSEQYGRVLFYDFAGDPEYYSSHSAILENLTSSEGVNLYLLVSDLSQSDDFISKRYGYWLSFIAYNLQTPNGKSFVLPVGSHADKIKSIEIEKLSLLNRVSGKFSSCCEEMQIEASIALDCRKPGDMVNVIRKTVQSLSTVSRPVELMLETSTLLGLLLKDFARVPACTLQTLISHVKETGIPLPVDAKHLYMLIKELHSLGLLLIIEKEGDPLESHMIILKVATLTTEVHSKLFSKSAKQEMAQYTDPLNLSVGIIPESLLGRLLPAYITKECLLKLQYCQEIENVNVDEDHSLTQSRQMHSSQPELTPAANSLLFFPALCQLKKEDINITWVTSPNSGCALGWYAKCEEDTFDYFPTRFLHVLTVRLALNFALKQCLPSSPSLNSLSSTLTEGELDTSLAEIHQLNPRCHVWTTGLHWLMENGVEVYVDVIKEAENKELVVVTRSSEDCRVECANTLQNVVQKVIEAKVEFCHSIMPTVYLLDPIKLKNEPFPNAKNVPLYTLSDVEKVLVEGKKKAVSVDGHHSSSPQDLTNLAQWTMSYWNLLFPMHVDKVESAIREAKWKLLGINLGVPYKTLEAIDYNLPRIEQKETEMIQTWMTGKTRPTWSTLVEALRSRSINLLKKADDVSREHNVPLQDQIIDSANSSVRPNPKFLQSFASIVGSRWQCLASLLSLTSEDIVSIKRETCGAEPSKQALVMLQKWANSEAATYGQLRERLCSLSVFHI